MSGNSYTESTNWQFGNNDMLKVFYIVSFLLFAGTSQAWTIDANFNSGTVGEKADGGGDGFHGAGGFSLYSTDQRLKGQAAQLTINAGSTGYGSWGGEFIFPEKAVQGDTLWFNIHTYFPSGFDHYSYGEGNRLKFFRIQTKSNNGDNHGYNDVYINTKDNDTPFLWIYEGQAKWSSVGESSDLIKKDTWENYQMSLVLDSIHKDDGGLAEVWIWKNGLLLTHITDRITLKDATDYADRALMFTYWNGGSPKTQTMYVDEIKLTNERPNTSDTNGTPYLPNLNSNKPVLNNVVRN